MQPKITTTKTQYLIVAAETLPQLFLIQCITILFALIRSMS